MENLKWGETLSWIRIRMVFFDDWDYWEYPTNILVCHLASCTLRSWRKAFARTPLKDRLNI